METGIYKDISSDFAVIALQAKQTSMQWHSCMALERMAKLHWFRLSLEYLENTLSQHPLKHFPRRKPNDILQSSLVYAEPDSSLRRKRISDRDGMKGALKL